MRVDYHLHTGRSCDAAGTIDEVCRRALEVGLDEVCVTEHLDCDPGLPEFGFYRHEAVAGEIAAARERFGERLVIGHGIEVEFQSAHARWLRRTLEGLSFDFVLGSVHSLFGEVVGPGTFGRWPREAIYRAYFDENDAMVDSGLIDGVGHLDVFRRHWDPTAERSPMPDYDRRLDGLLGRVVAADIVLEVSAKGFRTAGETNISPPRFILERYRVLGGRAVTVGSDAHRPAEVGQGFDACVGRARAAGLTHLATFRHRRRRLIPLPAAP